MKLLLNLNEVLMCNLQVVCQVVLLQCVCLKTMRSRVKVIIPNATDEAFSLKHTNVNLSYFKVLFFYYFYIFASVFIRLICFAF